MFAPESAGQPQTAIILSGGARAGYQVGALLANAHIMRRSAVRGPGNADALARREELAAFRVGDATRFLPLPTQESN
jgi:hypothetical protein